MTRRLFLDCDGVLADFDAGAEAVFGVHPRVYEDQYGTTKFWATLHSELGFYENLPVMHDALSLFDAVKHWNPIILTGCPLGGWAQDQKLKWRDKHFPGVPMITTLSKDKRSHAQPGDILVDDYLKYRHLWEEMGGLFIHHVSAAQSIEAVLAQESDRLAALEQFAADAVRALKATTDHCAELAEAWSRGCISEHDAKGGTRSNRNWDAVMEARAVLKRATEIGVEGCDGEE